MFNISAFVLIGRAYLKKDRFAGLRNRERTTNAEQRWRCHCRATVLIRRISVQTRVTYGSTLSRIKSEMEAIIFLLFRSRICTMSRSTGAAQCNWV